MFFVAVKPNLYPINQHNVIGQLLLGTRNIHLSVSC